MGRAHRRGISSASGIPTYRDHQGKWLGSNPSSTTSSFVTPSVGAIGPISPWLATRRSRPTQCDPRSTLHAEAAGIISEDRRMTGCIKPVAREP